MSYFFHYSTSLLTHLVRLIEHCEFTWVLILWRILKIVNVFTHNLPIGDQVAHPVNHVRNHHDLIRLLIGELEWLLCCFDIIGHNNWISTLDTIRYSFQSDHAGARGDRIPEPNTNVYGRVIQQPFQCTEVVFDRSSLRSIATRKWYAKSCSRISIIHSDGSLSFFFLISSSAPHALVSSSP